VFQMKTFAPLQRMNLAKSFIIFFLVASVAWIATSYVMIRDFYIGWPVLIGNVVMAGVVGWWWYRSRYHTIFSWGQQGFELQRGRRPKSSRKWRDFSRVSLVHEEHGRFVVRLYEDGGEYVDIPASDLKLDPSDFRFEVMELVKGRSPN
jgi:hypothetical protein